MKMNIGAMPLSPAGCLIAVVLVIILFPLLLVLAVSYLLVMSLRRLFGIAPRRPQFSWAANFSRAPGAGEAEPAASASASASGERASEEVIDVVAVEVTSDGGRPRERQRLGEGR